MEKSDSWEGSPIISDLDMDHFRIRKRKHMQTNAKKGRFFNIWALQLCMAYLPYMLNQLRSLGVPLSLSHINTHLYNFMHKHINVYTHLGIIWHHWVKWVNTLQQCFTVFHRVLVCPRRSHALGRRNGSSQGERLAYLSWGAELNQPSASPTAELQGTMAHDPFKKYQKTKDIKQINK